MKGIVFTMDALFALVIAAAGISILLYVTYTAQAPAAIHYSDNEAILQSLASTSISAVANSSWIAQGIMAQYTGANETSPGFLGGPYASGGGVSGPLRPILDFAFNPQNTITTGVVAAYGNIYFAANDMLYSVNATTNRLAWSVNTITNVVQTPVLYSGMLFFANTTNLTALNAGTGARVWSTNSISASGTTPTSQMLAYDNQIIVGTSNAYVNAYWASNGTSYWSNYTGTSAVALALVGGDIAAKTSSGSLDIIVHAGASAKQIYSKALASGNTPTRLAGSATRLLFGTADYANATYVNGTTASGFPIGTSQSVTGVAYYGSYSVYQMTGGDVAIAPSGTVAWAFTSPSYFGSALTNATPVVTGSMLYTLWSNGLAAQNLSTGDMLWFAGLQGSISPYMTLAYGRLYIVANNEVLAYGSCFSPLHATLLSAVSTMYLDGQAGCGAALLNSLHPNANYSFFVGPPSTNTLLVASFNGASGYIGAGPTGLPSGTQAQSVFAWIYVPANANGDYSIVNFGTPSGVEYVGLQDFNGYLRFTTWSAGYGPGPVVKTGMWNFVGYTIPSAGTNVTLYDNGVSDTLDIAVLDIVPGSFHIGADNGALNYFDGYIADIQVYDTALSTGNVQQLYAEGAKGAPLGGRGIVAWYPLAGDANDYSGLNPGLASGGVGYATTAYTLHAFASSYIVSKASIPLPVLNYTTGTSNTLNVGVYSWS